MKRTLLFTIFACSLFLNTAYAQTPYESLVAYRAQYPTPMATAAQIGELLNRVAWEFRAQGARLLGKKGGSNCPTPSGVLISCDYLVHGPSLTGHDVFQDAGPGGLTRPVQFTWGPGKEDLAGAIASGARTLVEPTLPDSTTDPSVPTIPDPGTDVPNPGTPATPALTLLQQTINEFRQEYHEETVKAEAERIAARAFRTEVGVQWGNIGKFVAKYGSIIAGAVLGGKLFSGSEE